jgi:hypothetical protein
LRLRTRTVEKAQTYRIQFWPSQADGYRGAFRGQN